MSYSGTGVLRRWYGSPAPTMDHARERFWTLVEKGDGSWLWKGTVHRSGYGMVSIFGERHRSNRAAWLLANGPIPDGMHVLHKCDNKRCVRPNHLYLGTHADNMRDLFTRGHRNHARGVGHGRTRLTVEQVREIRCRPAGTTYAELSRRYGVSYSTVRKVALGENWRDQL